MIDTSVFTPENLQARIDRHFQENPEDTNGLDAYGLIHLNENINFEVITTFEEGTRYRLEFNTAKRYLVLETHSGLDELCKDAVALADFLNA